jgi:hypothetical protein
LLFDRTRTQGSASEGEAERLEGAVEGVDQWGVSAVFSSTNNGLWEEKRNSMPHTKTAVQIKKRLVDVK